MLESATGSQPDLSSPIRTLAPDIKHRAAPRFRLGMPELVTLCLYAGLLAWSIPHHEPWADEAQAWQIARTLPLGQIFRTLSYEGHPALWYVCLWVLSRLHVSYIGMHWVAAAFGFLGVTVLVTAAPFPRPVKLLLPFTFYLAFQYAIVARSYVLIPLLLFLCAYFWSRRLQRPLTVALCLGLLANVAPHAAAVSGGLAIVYLIDLWMERRKPDVSVGKVYPAAALLLALYGISILTAFPSKDASGAGLVFMPNPAVKEVVEAQQSQLTPPYPHPEPGDKRSIQWLAWKVESRLSGGLTEGLIHPFWLGCVFWVLLTWKLFRTRKLHYLIPALFLVVLCHAYGWFWHSGLMFLYVIALLWMTWPPQESPFRKLPLYEQLPLAMLLLIALVQISWAQFAFQFDHAHDYGSGTATAAFLRPYVTSHARIVEIGNDFLSVGSQAYFDHKIFLNQPYAYYWWSIRNPGKSRYQELLKQTPEIVVLEWRFRDFPTGATIAAIPLAKQLDGLGFRNTRSFCGGLVEPGRNIMEWDCDLIYQPN
jgi:hypothetical protein